MNRTAQLFRRLKTQHRCGLIAYVTCGDGPTVDIIRALEDAGADAIELGVPFSDPIADGPVIQAAAMRALKRGTNISDIFTIARAIRERSEIPLIAFSYLNPVLRYGIDRFADDTKNAGIDSVLLTDLPAEAANEVKPAFKARGLGSIFLLAPTSSNTRIAAVNRVSDDFVYYVSTTGVTGARSELDPALLARLDEVRAQVTKPLAVGFGISKHEHYEALKDRCDAIVVGSAIVRAVGDGDAAGAAERAGVVVGEILRPA
ncbi:MAG TPA: tryptophan synthase subunit alpha [Thermoanaerobaculia bacterium]|jgi:tryptophan synthase alpha chain|nr:tryptophan synthase subunit alpha [Thermoanaerobaculia bacterium]